MFKQDQTYEPVGANETHAELADWGHDPNSSVESRNNPISIHRRPGFYKKGLLGSVAINAILLMVCGLMYFKLNMSAYPSSFPENLLVDYSTGFARIARKHQLLGKQGCSTTTPYSLLLDPKSKELNMDGSIS